MWPPSPAWLKSAGIKILIVATACGAGYLKGCSDAEIECEKAKTAAIAATLEADREVARKDAQNIAETVTGVERVKNEVNSPPPAFDCFEFMRNYRTRRAILQRHSGGMSGEVPQSDPGR